MPQDKPEIYLASGSRSCCTHITDRVGYRFRVRCFDDCNVVTAGYLFFVVVSKEHYGVLGCS